MKVKWTEQRGGGTYPCKGELHSFVESGTHGRIDGIVIVDGAYDKRFVRVQSSDLRVDE